MKARSVASVSFLILLLLVSCGPKPKVKPLPEKGSPEAVLADLTSNEATIISVAQSLDIAISTPDLGERSLSGTLYFKDGRYLFQIEAMLGKDVAKWLITRDSLLAFSPMQKRYYVGRPNSPLPQWGIGARDMLDILIGKYGFRSGRAVYVGLADDYYFFELAGGESTKKITVRPDLVNITAIRYESEGENIDVQFSDFSMSKASYRPREIALSARGRATSIRVSIKSEKLNSDLPDGVFELHIPDDAVEETANRFWQEF